MQGGGAMAFVDFPSILIVGGGTIGALITANPPEKMKGFRIEVDLSEQRARLWKDGKIKMSENAQKL